MEEFIRKYEGRVLDDWGVACSTEFKTFANNFKNALYQEFPESTIYGFQANCYILSGFVKNKEKTCIYFLQLSEEEGFRSEMRTRVFRQDLRAAGKGQKRF